MEAGSAWHVACGRQCLAASEPEAGRLWRLRRAPSTAARQPNCLQASITSCPAHGLGGVAPRHVPSACTQCRRATSTRACFAIHACMFWHPPHASMLIHPAHCCGPMLGRRARGSCSKSRGRRLVDSKSSNRNSGNQLSSILSQARPEPQNVQTVGLERSCSRWCCAAAGAYHAAGVDQSTASAPPAPAFGRPLALATSHYRSASALAPTASLLLPKFLLALRTARTVTYPAWRWCRWRCCCTDRRAPRGNALPGQGTGSAKRTQVSCQGAKTIKRQEIRQPRIDGGKWQQQAAPGLRPHEAGLAVQPAAPMNTI